MTDDRSATLLPFPAPPGPESGSGSGSGSTLPGPALDAYRLLARAGRLTPGQVAAGIGLPPDRACEALTDLLRLRLVRRAGDGAVVAVPHPQALEEVLADQARLLARAAERLAAGSRELDALLEGRSRPDPGRSGRIASTVLGAAADLTRSELVRGARESVLALCPGPLPADPERRQAPTVAAACRDRGVRLRVVHEAAALGDPAGAEYLDRLAAVGCPVRVRDRVPFPLLLVDGRLAVCALPDQGSFLLTGDHLLVLLTRVFETTWVDARPAPTRHRPAGPPPQVGPREPGPAHLAVLRLLAAGHTDRSAARTLGITTRTLTRRVRELYDLLGVDSRFQAGIVARERGLVPPPG